MFDALRNFVTRVLTAVLTGLENMLDPLKRHLSCNMMSEVLRACLVLSESDSNKPHLRSSNLLHLTVETLKLYSSNAPRLTITRSSGVPADFGGGGSDPESAQLCIEILLQLSFCFPNESEWRTAVVQQCPHMNDVLLTLKNLSADRSLDMHTMLSLKHLLGTLDHAAPPLAVCVSPAPAAEKKHAMLSYCWGAKKELVVELGTRLKARGVDVWRDEEGSHCVPAMSGSTDECMAAAIEHSHTIIICVSPAYKSSANCRMEAKYANDMHKRGKVKLIFVMMEQGYTTRSSPEYVDGWLGLMIGDQLWHAMWAGDQVDAVAAAIHVAIGLSPLPGVGAAPPSAAASLTAARPASQADVHTVTAASTLPPPAYAEKLSQAQPLKALAASSQCSPSLKRPAGLHEPSPKSVRMMPPSSPAAAAPAAAAAALSTTSPTFKLSSPSFSQLEQSHLSLTGSDSDAAAALAAAYDCLQDVDKACDCAALAALLHSLGITAAADLAFVDDAATMRITALLKPAAANFFAINIGHAMNIGYAMRSAQRSAFGPKNECFSYLFDATKHSDNAAMSALLEQLGITHPHELQYLDDSQLSTIVALFKPVAAKVFAHMMGFVKRL